MSREPHRPRVQADLSCVCGAQRQLEMPVRTGEASLAVLTLVGLRVGGERCACGRQWSQATGAVSAIAPLPGTESWAGWHTRLPDGEHSMQLRPSPQHPPHLLDDAHSEWDLAHLAGVPLHAPAAWHEALVLDDLSLPSAFPLGAGLWGLIGQGRPTARRQAPALGALVGPVPADASWLARRRAEHARMWVWHRPGEMVRRIAGLCTALDLTATRRGEGVAIGDGPNLPWVAIEVEDVLDRALMHGVSGPVALADAVLSAHVQLRRRMQVLRQIVARLRPHHWEIGDDGDEVVIQLGRHRHQVQLSELGSASDEGLVHLIRALPARGLD